MSKNNKKYDWRIGSELPQLDEHSHTKHLIIADYLKRYVEVYMSNTNIERLPLTIVDGFAGGGKYRGFDDHNVVDGSPFLILKSLKEAEAAINIGRKKPRHIETEYHFIEKEAPHLEFLRHELATSEFSHLVDKTAHLYRGTFAKVAPAIVSRIQQRNRSMRAIFILDQYAYKDVPFPLINTILSSTNSEIILTFNYDTLQGFLSENSTNRKALENIGLAQYIDWQRFNVLKEAGMWQQAIQEQLANAILQASGAKHITLFFIKPKKGWTYWLVHLSKVYRARDVMMDLHWKHSNVSTGFEHYLGNGLFALGYQACKIPGQNTLDFGEVFDFGADAKKKCISDLSEAIPRLLDNQGLEIPFHILTDTIGSLTPASAQEIRIALQGAMKNKEIIVMNKNGNPRSSANQINGEDIIKYHQRQFIFL